VKGDVLRSSVLLLILCSPAFAQPSGQAAPARDQRTTAPAGSAVIRGRIVASDSGRPLRRVLIRLTGGELTGGARTANTSADGRYEIRDLPAGRFTITVSRGGYLQLKYGQRRPFEQAKPLQVLEHQVVEHVDFALPKMSLITGHVTDDTGDPVENVIVLALRSMYLNGRRQLVPVGKLTETDDSGGYRLTGLAPGNYVVQARASDKWIVDVGGREETMGFAPTYAPGVTHVTEAQKIVVGLGQEAGDVDFSLVPARTARIFGSALDSRGRPFRNVSLGSEVRGLDFGRFGSAGSATVAPDGAFTIKDVAPGEYKVRASSRDSVNAAPEVAIIPVTIDGVDVDNVVLTGSAGGTVAGQLVVDGDPLPKSARVRITIAERTLGQEDPMLVGFGGAANGQVKDDGTFVVNNVFGPARIDVVNLPDGWALKAILHGGQDITDAPVSLKSGEQLTGVQVAIITQLTKITAQIVDEKGAPVIDGTLMVFPTDSAKWFDNSRAVRAARPDQKGDCELKGLPPGEYLVVAVDYVEEGLWYDPDYLESMRRYAQKLTVVDGQAQAVTARLVRPQQ
jgi:hypothetical protein